jgi:site-specific DNA-methyltransferase (adenine-specific)
MRTVTGNGWTMHLGDCLEVMATLGKVDHVITDPPYEAEAHTKGRRIKRAGGVREEGLPFPAITDDERVAASRLMGRLTRRWALVFCQAEGAMPWQLALRDSGLRPMRWCVWVKPDGQPQLTGDRPGVGYETIVCAHPNGRARWNGGGRTGVFVHNKFDPRTSVNGKAPHPTTKPLALLQELVELFTDPDETVLDAFAGSGTTGVACLRLGRRFIGIEKDPKYFELACERLSAEESGSTLQAARAGQTSLFGKAG